MQIPISWFLQKPTDLDLHCLQRQGISGLSRTRVKGNEYTFRGSNSQNCLPSEEWSTLKGRICFPWEQILSFLSRPLLRRGLVCSTANYHKSCLPCKYGRKSTQSIQPLLRNIVYIFNSFHASGDFCHQLIILQTVWTQVSSDKTSGLIWIQTV